MGLIWLLKQERTERMADRATFKTEAEARTSSFHSLAESARSGVQAQQAIVTALDALREKVSANHELLSELRYSINKPRAR